jgi:processive 1,2-diacylglycerol beta-glucosyltransferase
MKVSFIYVDAGKGHYTPAKALYDSYTKRGGDATLDNMILVIGSKFYNKVIKDWWRFFLHHPQLERLSNGFSDNVISYKIIENATKYHIFARKSFIKWYKKEKPDLIVCTNFLVAPILTTIIKETKISIPCFVYSADVFDCPNIGVSNDIDIHYLPSQLGINNCIRRGFDPSIVKLSPFPLKSGVAQYYNLSKHDAREQLGLDQDRPVIILNLGGEGIGNAEIPRALVRRHLDYQVIVLGNPSRETKFKFKKFKKEYPTFSLITPGFVNNVGVYIKACDVQMGKTGANSLLESMYLKRPFLMSQLLYTSKAFIDFMDEYKIGWAENSVRKQIDILENYFNDENEQNEIADVMENIPINFSSDDFIDMIIKDFESFNTEEKLLAKREYIKSKNIKRKNLINKYIRD